MFIPSHLRKALAILLLATACTSLPAPIAEIIQQPTESVPTREITEVVTPTAEPTLTATPSNVPDLSGQSIPIIHLCDRTGPFSAIHAGRIVAVENMVAAINASGGIFGAQLDLHFADTTASADGARAAYARMIRQVGEGPMFIVCDPFAEQAIAELVNEDEVPTLSPGLFAAEDGFLYGLDASPDKHFSYFLQDLLANWDARQPASVGGEIRLAILTWPSELSGEPATPGALEFVESLGVEIVFQEEMDPELDYNIFDLIYAVREENANVIYTNARGFGLAALLNGLNHLGLRERFVVGAPAFVYDNQLYEYLADPAFAAGFYLTSAWVGWTESEHASIQLAQTLLGDNEQYADYGFLQMLGAVDLARRALEDAILAEGFEALSPETVSEALGNLDGYPVLAGLFTANYAQETRSLSELRTWRVGETAGDLLPFAGFIAVPDY